MRLVNLLIDAGNRHDVVSAVMAVQKTNPAGAFQAVEQLGRWVEKENWMEILPAYSRCVRITRDQSDFYEVDPGLLVETAEKNLYQCIIKAEMTPREKGSVDEMLQVFIGLIPAINQFFNEVLVMADDARLSKNRLGLLQRISSMANGVANLSYLEGF
jgi:glycyl-tRNA synthetase